MLPFPMKDASNVEAVGFPAQSKRSNGAIRGEDLVSVINMVKGEK